MMIDKKDLELLSPAGDIEGLKTAIRYGADAVYVGGDLLQLRADKVGFDRDGLKTAVEIAHAAKKKLYVTVNSFAKNNEILPLVEYAKFLSDIQVDAAIISDLGVLATVKKSAPDLEVHISTQANCQNYATAQVYYDMGAARIVLAREMSLEDIAQLRARVPRELELEAFVHGAMCMSYSGRCLISSFINNRSGNRGECTQPCRWNYYLVEQKRPNEYFEVIEDNGASAVLSSHDLNCISFIDKIAQAGVKSFKIEGRMKTPFYTATVTNAYRHAIDKTAELETLEYELESVSHRPFSKGFYFGELIKNHNNNGVYTSECRFIGVIKGRTERGYLVEQRNFFSVNETLELLSPKVIGSSFRVKEIINSSNESIETAFRVQEIVELIPDTLIPLEVGDILRRREHIEIR